jgi:hypothetical protein
LVFVSAIPGQQAELLLQKTNNLSILFTMKRKYLPLLALIIISLNLTGCAFLAELILPEAEASMMASLARAGSRAGMAALPRAIAFTEMRAGAMAARVTGMSTGVAAGVTAGLVLELKDYAAAMDLLYRVRVGNSNARYTSLYISENGDPMEIARVIGETENHETVVQFYDKGKAVTKPFSLPGRLYRISKNEKAALYTGRGDMYKVYHATLQKDEMVFVLEEMKDGFYYVQYQDVRGYMKASDISVVALVMLAGDKNKDVYRIDETGTGGVCFTNRTNKNLSIVLCQSTVTELTNGCGPRDGGSPMVWLKPYETACFYNLPVSKRYEYQVYEDFSEDSSIYRRFDQRIEMDKGGVLIEKGITRFISIEEGQVNPRSYNDGIYDNEEYRQSLLHPMTGDLGFKNNTLRTVSVILCDNGGICSEGNFGAPEYMLRPRETKYFFQLQKNKRYDYQVSYKDSGGTRYDFMAYNANRIEANSFIWNNQPLVKSVGFSKESSASGEQVKGDVGISNKTRRTIVAYLCRPSNVDCSSSDFNAKEMFIGAGETKYFYELENGADYEVAIYRWEEGITRYDFMYFQVNLLKLDRFTVNKGKTYQVKIGILSSIVK